MHENKFNPFDFVPLATAFQTFLTSESDDYGKFLAEYRTRVT